MPDSIDHRTPSAGTFATAKPDSPRPTITLSPSVARRTAPPKSGPRLRTPAISAQIVVRTKGDGAVRVMERVVPSVAVASATRQDRRLGASKTPDAARWTD